MLCAHQIVLLFSWTHRWWIFSALFAIILAPFIVFWPMECEQRWHGPCPGLLMKPLVQFSMPSLYFFGNLRSQLMKEAVTKMEGAEVSASMWSTALWPTQLNTDARTIGLYCTVTDVCCVTTVSLHCLTYCLLTMRNYIQKSH